MGTSNPVKVMQIIARMNVGGPAVLVADLMRNLDPCSTQWTPPEEVTARDGSSQCWRWHVRAVFAPLSASQVAS
jgi:hypothetical protein